MSRQGHRTWSIHNIQKAADMRRSGMRYCDICKHFGVSRQAVASALNRRAISAGRNIETYSNAKPGSRLWYRVQSGLSVQEICEKADVTKSTIYRWEDGGSIGKLHKVRAVCNVLGCTVSQYLGHEIVWGKGSAK